MKNSIKNLAIAASVAAIVFSAKAETKKELKKLENYAYLSFKAQNYADALVAFTKLDNLSSDKVRYDYMIGMCLMSTENSHTALPYFRSAMVHPTTSFVINYYIGRSYILAGNYQEALNYLTSYKSQLTEYIEETNFKFSINPASINEKNKIHMEKTLEDVAGFMSMCVEKNSTFSAKSE